MEKMAKELTDLFESVKRAAEEVERTPSEEDRCMDGLKLLRNFPVNCDVLQSTQIGKRIRPLTKHANEKIKSSASEVVATWKSVITAQLLNSDKKCSASENAGPRVLKELRRKPKIIYGNNVLERLESMKSSGTESAGSEALEKPTRRPNIMRPTYPHPNAPKARTRERRNL